MGPVRCGTLLTCCSLWGRGAQNKLMVALKAKLTEVSKKLSKAEFDNSMLKVGVASCLA